MEYTDVFVLIEEKHDQYFFDVGEKLSEVTNSNFKNGFYVGKKIVISCRYESIGNGKYILHNHKYICDFKYSN